MKFPLPKLWRPLGGLIALAAIFWCYGVFASNRSAALRAVADWQTSERWGRQIQLLRQQPSRAGSRELEAAELVQPIEKSAKDAGIASDSLVRIWPQPAQRLGQSAYLQKPTQVLLRQVNLQQIFRFLHTLSASETGLGVGDLRLSLPREPQTVGLWNAELTLTYLIYQPQTTTPKPPPVSGDHI